MKTEKLIIEEGREGYHLVWYFPEEEDIGGYLGEGGEDEFTEESLTRATEDTDRENILATLAAKPFADSLSRYNGLVFVSKAKAQAALKAANSALKIFRDESKKNKPWPEWAKTAAAAGWKPPKGWEP